MPPPVGLVARPDLGLVLAASRSLQAERLRLVAIAAVLPLAFGLLLLVARTRDRVPRVPRILSEPPEDLHPVNLALLWSAYRHHLSSRTAFRTEILHLARTGAIGLIPVGRMSDPRDFTLTFHRMPEDEVDAEFVRFLFPEPERSAAVSLRSLRTAGGGGERLRRWWDGSFGRVGLAVQRIWTDERPELLAAFFLGVLAPPSVEAVLAPDFERLAGLEIGVWTVGAVGWLLTAWMLLARLPEPLRARLQRWGAFRRHLKQFSSVRDAPAAAVVIWERYLEDAVALGLAGQVERQVHALAAAPSLPLPWSGAPGGEAGTSWVRHLWRRGPVRAPESLHGLKGTKA